MNQTTIPEGYRKNAEGHLIPISTIKEIDLERDRLVHEIVEKAKNLNEKIADFKEAAFGDIAAFIDLSAEKYGVTMRGVIGKGNITLFSFDGQYKVQRAISEHLVFDERLMAAKALIDACITEWAHDSRPEIQVLVNDAFRVDKAGKINTGRVLGLRRLSIEDERWKQAMQAISESVQVVGSKSYIRVYERIGETDQYRSIPLDIAGV